MRAPAGAAPAASASAPDKDDLRRQSSAERFAREGSEKLWCGLLDWAPERLERIKLCDALHDGVLWKQAAARPGSNLPPYTASGALQPFAARYPETAARLSLEDFDQSVQQWLAEGDELVVGQTAARWTGIAELCENAGLGPVTARALQNDWETWIAMAFASKPRVTLLESVKMAEGAANALHIVAGSDRIADMARVLRALWSGVAYGDETTLNRVRAWAAELESDASGDGATKT